MKRKKLNLFIGVLLAIVFGLWLFVFKVRQSEIALVTTFGKPTGAPIDEPGAYFKWPWPIQKVHLFDKRIQNLDDALEESSTADGKIITCKIYLGWQIKDPAAFYPKFASSSLTDPEGDSISQAQLRLEDMARSAKRARLGKHPFSDLITTDASQFKFEQIENEMLADLQANVSSNNYGIELKYLGIKQLGLPQSTTEKVFDAMKSEQAVLVADIQAKGTLEAARIRQEASSQSQRLIAEAEAQAKTIQAQGQEQAAKYLEVFQQDPPLANFLLELHALEASLGSKSVLIFDRDTDPFGLFTKPPTATGK